MKVSNLEVKESCVALWCAGYLDGDTDHCTGRICEDDPDWTWLPLEKHFRNQRDNQNRWESSSSIAYQQHTWWCWVCWASSSEGWWPQQNYFSCRILVKAFWWALNSLERSKWWQLVRYLLYVTYVVHSFLSKLEVGKLGLLGHLWSHGEINSFIARK